jgi:hypothetical protein
MVALSAATLLALGVVCALARRSVLYPPALYPLVWGSMLAFLALTGDLFYPLSSRTLTVYVLGAIAFSVAGLTADVLHPSASRLTTEQESDYKSRGVLLWFMFIVLVLLAPIYWNRLREAVGDTTALDFMYRARISATEATEAGTSWLGPVENAVPFSILFAIIAFSMPARSRSERILRYAIYFVALAYQLSTGGRVGATMLVLGTATVVMLRTRRLNLATFLATLGVFVAVFGSVAILVRKGATTLENDSSGNVKAVAENFVVYTLGGIVAFDRLTDDQGAVPSTGGVARAAMQLANKAGAHFETPSLFAQYTTVGTGYEINVYTAYADYYRWHGFFGVVLLTGAMGAVITLVFRRAQIGSPEWRVLYAIFAYGIFQSVFNEPFYSNLTFLLKATVVLLLIQLARHFATRRTYTTSAVSA